MSSYIKFKTNVGATVSAFLNDPARVLRTVAAVFIAAITAAFLIVLVFG